MPVRAGVGLSACTAMATTASLTLRALLSQATARANLDRLAPITAGLTPAAKALAAVAAARAASGLTVLVAPSDKDVEQLTSDARFLYGALEGASEAAVEAAVLPLPSLQVDPYRGMSPHFRVAAARARALHAAATGTARLVIASAAALLPRVSPREKAARGINRHPCRHGDRARDARGSAGRRRFHS